MCHEGQNPDPDDRLSRGCARLPWNMSSFQCDVYGNNTSGHRLIIHLKSTNSRFKSYIKVILHVNVTCCWWAIWLRLDFLAHSICFLCCVFTCYLSGNKSTLCFRKSICSAPALMSSHRHINACSGWCRKTFAIHKVAVAVTRLLDVFVMYRGYLPITEVDCTVCNNTDPMVHTVIS